MNAVFEWGLTQSIELELKGELTGLSLISCVMPNRNHTGSGENN